MKNVLIINPILYTSETNEIPKVDSIKDTMIYTMCMGFLKLGHRVTLVAAEDYKPCVGEEYPFPVIWMHTVCRRVFLPRCFPYMPDLRKLLKEHEEYDLIIASEMFATWSYTAVRLCPEKTIVWHELAAHNRMLHQIPSKIWYNVIARFMMRKARVIARSKEAQTFISRFVGNVSQEVIDHGVELEKLPRIGSESEESVKSSHTEDFLKSNLCLNSQAEKEWKMIKKENQFAVVSQLIERKQIHRTIAAFADFAMRGNEDYILYLIGQGEEESSLRKAAADRKIESQVRFCGQMTHEQLLPIVAKSKALLVYTKKDNNMVSIVESIAVGTPVVTTSVPYNAEYIRREKLGIVKDLWGAEELDRICEQNEVYVRNCLQYRQKLSNVHCAEMFLHCAQNFDGKAGSGD
ncbi:MAG: glycosyltransferase family 4 protein [Lachnospiraceae bacterium]|nr:glycosyltransferase family 4 protein [Lachnospiraceae bacterium]